MVVLANGRTVLSRVAELQAEGVSRREACRRTGVSESSLRTWQKKYAA